MPAAAEEMRRLSGATRRPLRHRKKYGSLSNGSAERPVQTVEVQVRVMLLALDRRLTSSTLPFIRRGTSVVCTRITVRASRGHDAAHNEALKKKLGTSRRNASGRHMCPCSDR